MKIKKLLQPKKVNLVQQGETTTDNKHIVDHGKEEVASAVM